MKQSLVDKALVESLLQSLLGGDGAAQEAQWKVVSAFEMTRWKYSSKRRAFEQSTDAASLHAPAAAKAEMLRNRWWHAYQRLQRHKSFEDPTQHSQCKARLLPPQLYLYFIVGCTFCSIASLRMMQVTTVESLAGWAGDKSSCWLMGMLSHAHVKLSQDNGNANNMMFLLEDPTGRLPIDLSCAVSF